MGALKYCVVLALLYFIPVGATTTVFHTNCTRPPSGSSFNFVTAPNTRGTLEILWSCLLTLLICTWQVQHLNVPPQTMTGVALFWRKPFWMLLTVLAPETLLGIALEDFLGARRSVRDMKREFPNLVAQGGWTMTHAFYALMYGFVVRRRVVVAEADRDTAPDSTNAITFRPPRPSETEILILNTERMITYFRSLPSPIVFVTEAEIQRRAKTDIFIKCVAGFQVFWFIVQVCARKVRNVAISQLEVAVLAFAVCTLITYLLWMKKPQDAIVPTFLDEGPKLLPITPDWHDDRHPNVYASYYKPEGNQDFSLPFDIYLSVDAIGISAGGTIFGAIHLLAWNLLFPTRVEKLLWRTLSIATTAIPALLLPIDILDDKYGMYLVPLGLIPIYAICRVFLVVETFRSLGFLSPGAFGTTWSTYMPHVT